MINFSPAEIGFVVIGRNEGARLQHCLKSVLTASERVVYADSASNDGSAELAERLGAIVVRLPADGRLTAARGRNAGYAELKRRFSDCRLVQFLDGDCIMQPDWIDSALNFLGGNPEVAVVCGRRFEAHPEASIFNALCDHEWDTPVGEANECGGDAMVRCEAYDQVGGYRADLQAGEEPEMTARMRAVGWKIWRIDVRMTEHDARILSLRQWWRRAQRGGFGFAQVWMETRKLPNRLYAKQLRSALTWVVLIPLISVLIAIVVREPMLLILLPLLYVAQLWRIRKNSQGRTRWTYAALIMLAKFPEAVGAGRFLITRAARVPEYKNA